MIKATLLGLTANLFFFIANFFGRIGNYFFDKLKKNIN